VQVLVGLKREFPLADVATLWECTWTNPFTPHFSLFTALALLEHRRCAPLARSVVHVAPDTFCADLCNARYLRVLVVFVWALLILGRRVRTLHTADSATAACRHHIVQAGLSYGAMHVVCSNLRGVVDAAQVLADAEALLRFAGEAGLAACGVDAAAPLDRPADADGSVPSAVGEAVAVA
jgi:hypothetical protein